MSTPDLDTLWKSPHNQPSANDMEMLAQQLLQRLHKRYRGFLVITGTAALAMVILTVRFALHVARGGAFDVGREWVVLLIFLLPLTALGLFWRQQIQHRRQHAAAGRSIRDSLLALLAENRLAALRLKWIAIFHTIFLLSLPLMVYQLRDVNKAGDEILFPFLVGLPLILIGCLLAMRLQYRRQLLPQRRELEALLDSTENDAAAG